MLFFDEALLFHFRTMWMVSDWLQKANTVILSFLQQQMLPFRYFHTLTLKCFHH